MAKKNIINKNCENCGCLNKKICKKQRTGDRELLFYGCSKNYGRLSTAFTMDG